MSERADVGSDRIDADAERLSDETDACAGLLDGMIHDAAAVRVAGKVRDCSFVDSERR